jgi:hypothetical protein
MILKPSKIKYWLNEKVARSYIIGTLVFIQNEQASLIIFLNLI